MPLQKGFGRLGRVGFDEDGIRVRQIQAEVMNPRLDATQKDVGFAEIHLGTARRMRQGDKYFLLSQPFLGDELAHDRVAAGVTMFVTESLEYPHRRMALLLQNVAIILQDLMNDADERPQFRRYRRFLALIARRHGVPNHLRYRLAADPKPLCCSALALVLHHHGAPHLGV